METLFREGLSEDVLLVCLWRQIPEFGLDWWKTEILKAMLDGPRWIEVWSHAEHSQPDTTGAADRLVISEKRGTDRKRKGRKEQRENKKASMKGSREERLDPPLFFFLSAIKGVRTWRGGEAGGWSSAARQPNHYTTWVFRLAQFVLYVLTDVNAAAFC